MDNLSGCDAPRQAGNNDPRDDNTKDRIAMGDGTLPGELGTFLLIGVAPFGPCAGGEEGKVPRTTAKKAQRRITLRSNYTHGEACSG